MRLRRSGSPSSCSSSTPQRRAHRLDTSEHSVGVMPVRIGELRKVVRVLDVLEREARLEAPCEIEHLLALELFELVDLPLDVVRLRSVEDGGHVTRLDVEEDRARCGRRITRHGASALRTDAEAMRLRHPDVRDA